VATAAAVEPQDAVPGAGGAEAARQAAVERLAAAARSVSSHLELAAVLHELVEAATELAGARYGAVGVFAADGRSLREFITVGLSDEEVAAIGRPPTGRGLLGTLVHHPDPLRVDEVSAHPDSVGYPPGHPAMHSFLGVPIRVGGEVFGRLYLTEKRDGSRFTAQDESLISLFAAQAAVAVQNARLYEDSQRRLHDLEVLNGVAMAVAGQEDPAEVLRAVARAGRQLAGSDAAVVVVPDGDALRIAGADGRAQSVIWRLFRASRGAVTASLSDPAGRSPGPPPARGAGFAALPLRAGERVLGVLVVALPAEDGSTSGRAAPPAVALGTLAGLAASSLRLAEEYQGALASERRTRALFEVARVALGGGPLQEIVTAACERVLLLQRASAVAVLWGDAARLEVVAAAGEVDPPDNVTRPQDLEGFEWVRIPGEEGRRGWLGVRLVAGEELTSARRDHLEGWAGVIALAYRAERLRMMRRQVLVAEERSRIAMELHDGAVQRLYGVGMALQGAAMMAGDGDRRVADALASAVDEIDAAIREIRAYVHGLRPAGLAVETVRRIIDDDISMLSGAGIETAVDIDDEVLEEMSGDVGAEVVQVMAEACANMARYAHARHAQIRIGRRRGALVVSVSDDGVGFDPAVHVSGHGLKNLRERAARMAGELHVDSAPGKGTRLRLEVPL